MPEQTPTVGMERKLAAIFSTDVVGYSRLMGDDEAATIRTLTTYREVMTPLIAMHKAEIIRLGLELNAPFDLTWSCYQREDRACGVCDSCVLRLRAFRAVGTKDPIPYAEIEARR